MPRPAFTVAATFATLLPPIAAQEKSQPSAELAAVAAAYAAKVAASAIFVSGRTLESVLAEELAPTRPLEALIRPLLRFEVDAKAGTVTATLGQAKATAVRTQSLGCTLARPDVPVATLRERGAAPPDTAQGPDPAAVDWPLGERVPAEPPAGLDRQALARAVAAAFTDPPGKTIHTRAVVVVHQGRLVAERYADGYHAAMPLPGWSMTKTLTHALLGVRVAAGALDPDAPLPVPEWPAGDERGAIRLGDLLTMTAGLAWNEDHADPASDALGMLFRSTDHGAAYAQQPRAAAPGRTFCYASGATNLLCRVLRRTFTDDRDYQAFPRQALFAPLGMRGAVLETDPSGTFVGSSYGFATARDWARLGLLYANDGMAAGRRLLPAGWVAAATAATAASGGRYGQHLWLDRDPDGDGPLQREWPELPADLFYLSGHEGQYVFVLPADRLVVVRLGCSKNGGVPLRALLGGVRAALRT